MDVEKPAADAAVASPRKKERKGPIYVFPIKEKGKRTFAQELKYLKQVSPVQYDILPGFVPNMRVPGTFFVNDVLAPLVTAELERSADAGGGGGFIPAVKQIANVSSLPGIVSRSVAMPDVHSGYGFAIGNVAAFDMGDPEAIVSPGGVGFDINCGVRLLRTNLHERELNSERREELAQTLFDHIPVGVGSKGVIPTTMSNLNDALQLGMDWSLREGYAWPEDKERCEEQGRMLQADARKVSARAKKRGLTQMGTLGAGNHYAEIQVVDDIYDEQGAHTLGLFRGQIVVMIHSGSRGLGHQVATDALQTMETAMRRDEIHLNDRQLACARISSAEGQDYLKAMAAAANFAWVNRSAMTFLTRQAFAKVFGKTPQQLDMQMVYDVSHNIAKVETHVVDGVQRQLLVHRKGATRAFPPFHPLIPADYQLTGQPVLVGGTMGTCSYVLLGTETGMRETFGSTCHGAGRAQSRAACRKKLNYQQVLNDLKQKGIAIRVASPKLITEEAPDVSFDYRFIFDPPFVIPF